MWKFNLLNTKITDEKIVISKYVAKQMNRKYIGIEKEQTYFDMCVERLK